MALGALASFEGLARLGSAWWRGGGVMGEGRDGTGDRPRPETANGIPAIDRAIALMGLLETEPHGLDLAALAHRSDVSRSSVYRIVNTLVAHGLVRRVEGGRLVLGGRLVALGAAAGTALKEHVLPERLQPFLDRTAARLGETARLAVYDRGSVVLIAGASPVVSHALSYQIGQEMPVHAGGGSKVLLAHQPEAERRRVLARPLASFTPFTITDPVALAAELARIRAQGWGHDPGEFSLRVQSYAAPILAGDGQVAAALSVAFAATDDRGLHDAVRAGVIDAARDCGAALGDVTA